MTGGRVGLQMMKVTGSAFADFARDSYTTLPERKDRPLYIHLDVGWKYASPAAALDPSHAPYVAGEQVADLVGVVFHRFVSLSIQHLVNEIGGAMLERWPQLSEVTFEAQNRLWDLSVTSETDERVKVYCDPRPPFGRIGLVLRPRLNRVRLANDSEGNTKFVSRAVTRFEPRSRRLLSVTGA